MNQKSINSLLLDCGRKYFSLEDIKEIVNSMAANGFTTLILAFGNDGFRFLLDDMEISVFSHTYSSNLIKEKIHQANISYCDSGIQNELTQSEMDDLFEYCKTKNINIIPLLNSPGHMTVLLKAMNLLGFNDIRYKNSKTTIDLENSVAIEFLTELIRKYIRWFKSKGCEYFHLGCDEYANDVLPSGFADLQLPENNKYGCFIKYVNTLADLVINSGMTPLIFNDGMYIGNAKPEEIINDKVIASYWTKGWEGYNLADVQKIIDEGHSVLNTHCKWYYVLGRYTEETAQLDFTLNKSIEGMETFKKNNIAGCGSVETIGVTFCIWCDDPSVPYDDVEKENLEKLINCFGNNVIAN